MTYIFVNEHGEGPDWPTADTKRARELSEVCTDCANGPCCAEARSVLRLMADEVDHLKEVDRLQTALVCDVTAENKRLLGGAASTRSVHRHNEILQTKFDALLAASQYLRDDVEAGADWTTSLDAINTTIAACKEAQR